MESYRFIDIKRRVLIPAKKELDKKSEVSFDFKESYEDGTKGRKVMAISFAFFRKIPLDKLSKKKACSIKEKDFINSISNGYQLLELEKAKFFGLVNKYGRVLIIAILTYRHQEIDKYMKRTKNPKTFCEAVGVICEGLNQKSN